MNLYLIQWLYECLRKDLCLSSFTNSRTLQHEYPSQSKIHYLKKHFRLKPRGNCLAFFLQYQVILYLIFFFAIPELVPVPEFEVEDSLLSELTTLAPVPNTHHPASLPTSAVCRSLRNPLLDLPTSPRAAGYGTGGGGESKWSPRAAGYWCSNCRRYGYWNSFFRLPLGLWENQAGSWTRQAEWGSSLSWRIIRIIGMEIFRKF